MAHTRSSADASHRGEVATRSVWNRCHLRPCSSTCARIRLDKTAEDMRSRICRAKAVIQPRNLGHEPHAKGAPPAMTPSGMLTIRKHQLL